MAERDRLFSLDVLRGVAVVLVLIRHIPAKPADDETITTFFHQMGWTGVDLFFVLSGFLISGLLYAEVTRTGRLDLRRFWLRRGLKIWPSYYIIYGALAIALIVAGKRNPFGWLSNLFFFQNYVPHRERWPHSWSVAIEEHFYLLLPIVLLLLLRAGRLRLLPWICGAVCVVALAARVYFAGPGSQWLDFYYPTHYRVDSLMFGVLLGYAYHFHRERFDQVGRRAWPALLVAAAAVLVLAAIYRLEDKESTIQYTLGFTLLYLGFGGAVVVAGAFPGAGARNPIARALAWMGIYSYTIYLTHSVVMRFPGMEYAAPTLRHWLVQSPWVDRVLYMVLSVTTGWAASHAIERPFLRLRAKLFPRDASTGPAAPPGRLP